MHVLTDEPGKTSPNAEWHWLLTCCIRVGDQIVMIFKFTRPAVLFSLALVLTVAMNAQAFAGTYSISYIDVPSAKNFVAIDDFGDYTLIVGTVSNPSYYTHYADELKSTR